ncbi:hypothetical protein FRC05_003846 [Tulasnella sp. 425]|nr:hypothetical protein FRC05_003846 [Tulasnella sp. 425]
MGPSSNMPHHMTRLPVDLFVPIILLSFDTLNPVRRLIRAEELRLVSKAWQATIDSTPLFWTCIPNEASASEQAIQRWIRKSREAPLHILCTQDIRPVEVFMPLVTPHIHRWQKLEIDGQGSAISKYIKEPAPLLESLTIFAASLSSDEVAFGGVTPSLSSVSLRGVAIPSDLTFLRNLRDFSLRENTDNHQIPPLTKIRDVLGACPDLERLELDAGYTLQVESSMAGRPPIVMAKLSSFILRGSYNPHLITGTIFGMISAPRLASVRFAFDEYWAMPTKNILSSLSTELLLRHTKYTVFISDWRIAISTIDEEGRFSTSPAVAVSVLPDVGSGRAALKILEDVGKAAPLSATVDVILSHSNSAGIVIAYLKSTVKRIDGSWGHPLPQLRTVQLNARHQQNLTDTYETPLSDLAHAQPGIPIIRIKVWGRMGNDDAEVLQWDRTSSSFVSSQR